MTSKVFNLAQSVSSAYADGITGGLHSDIFLQNKKTVLASYTVDADHHAMSTGPIAIANGVTVTVATGSRWVIL